MRIATVRGQRVIVDSDLAGLCGVEQKTEALAMSRDTFNRNTRAQLKQVFDAPRELMAPPNPPKRPIGFINPEDKEKKGQARRET